jgi:capsular polysaccharide transport system ATP-binding protein
LGDSLGILAPNGTGKTTIINMMAGLEKPDEGEDLLRIDAAKE